MGAPRGYERSVTDSTLVFRGEGRTGRWAEDPIGERRHIAP